MIRTLTLAIALSISAPAWAYNECQATHPATEAEWEEAQKICARMGGNPNICAIKNAHTEAVALATAKAVLDHCDKNPQDARCSDEVRSYIKLRWGH